MGLLGIFSPLGKIFTGIMNAAGWDMVTKGASKLADHVGEKGPDYIRFKATGLSDISDEQIVTEARRLARSTHPAETQKCDERVNELSYEGRDRWRQIIAGPKFSHLTEKENYEMQIKRAYEGVIETGTMDDHGWELFKNNHILGKEILRAVFVSVKSRVTRTQATTAGGQSVMGPPSPTLSQRVEAGKVSAKARRDAARAARATQHNNPGGNPQNP